MVLKTNRAPSRAWDASPQPAAMDSEPDQRAGAVSKTDDGAQHRGVQVLRCPPFCPRSSAEEQPASNRKAGGANPPGDTSASTKSHNFIHPCSSAEEHPLAKREAEGATPSRDTLFHVPVAQQQSSRLITGRSKVRYLPGIPFQADALHRSMSVSQTTRVRSIGYAGFGLMCPCSAPDSSATESSY
jgi:hypothetical protein